MGQYLGLSNAEMKEIFHEIDVNKDNKMDLYEFVD